MVLQNKTCYKSRIESFSRFVISVETPSYGDFLFQSLSVGSHLISIPTKGNTKEHKKTNREPLKKPTNDIPQPESFPPTEEL